MNIAIVGTGYVGLVTGACFAEIGVHVTCIDVNKEKIAQLKEGVIPIWEPGLEDIVRRNTEKERLFFSTSLCDTLPKAVVVFIAVGTPPEEDGGADVSHVLNVAREIGSCMNGYLVVVTKSTVPVGTSQKVREVMFEEQVKRGVSIPFDVASNPEFLKEGSAVDDFLKPDRIVVGVDSEKAKVIIERLYKPFLLNGHPILFMDIRSSELTKYAANAMLATRISFMNDMAMLCELVGADVNMIRKGIGSDPRIGSKFLYPGAGYGGSCFPKDVKATISMAQEYDCSLDILKAVEKVNSRQKELVFRKVSSHFKDDLKDKTFAVLGLSFKPNTDDMREAPSLTVISLLQAAGAKVVVYDPVAMGEAGKLLGEAVVYADSLYSALDGADALLLMTEWAEFRILDYRELKKRMRRLVVVDGRNIYDAAEMKEHGITYYCIGRT